MRATLTSVNETWEGEREATLRRGWCFSSFCSEEALAGFPIPLSFIYFTETNPFLISFLGSQTEHLNSSWCGSVCGKERYKYVNLKTLRCDLTLLSYDVGLWSTCFKGVGNKFIKYDLVSSNSNYIFFWGVLKWWIIELCWRRWRWWQRNGGSRQRWRTWMSKFYLRYLFCLSIKF